MSDATSPVQSSGLGTSSLGGNQAALGSALGKEDFLKLLMSQLQHQDPMQPMADQEFVAQLAQFSGLEQQMLANDRLEQLQLAQLSAGNAQLAGFIGKDITAHGDTIRLDGQGVPPISVDLSAPAASVKVTVRDQAGKVVSSFDAGAKNQGTGTIPWSGKDPNGNPLPPGNYKVEITATDAGGQPVAASALSHGACTGLPFENGYAELLIGDRRVLPADIVSIDDGSAPGTSVPPAPISPNSTGSTTTG